MEWGRGYRNWVLLTWSQPSKYRNYYQHDVLKTSFQGTRTFAWKENLSSGEFQYAS